MIRRIANLIWELKGLNAFFAHTMWISRLGTESFGKLYDFRWTIGYESFFLFFSGQDITQEATWSGYHKLITQKNPMVELGRIISVCLIYLVLVSDWP